jgi:RNA polymerase sigma-70 factor, ECF subfamily
MNNRNDATGCKPMDDAELRRQLELHHDASFGWAMSCCARNRADAEDVLQTAYLKVLQSKARFDGRASFRTWLFSVIRYTAADERRRHWLRNLRTERYERECESLPDQQPPLFPSDDAEARRYFEDALRRLPRRQQEVLHLVFYQDMTIEEAAKVMDVSLGSARTHYERGKEKLRSVLDKEYLQ